VFLGVSPHVDGPVLIGWWRPTILLPPGPHDRLSDTEAEATLAHELAHVRRGDYAVNLVQSFAEAVLFYHPVMWWLGERVRDEREYCSDDLAHRSIRGSLMDYLRALATLESLRGRAAPEPAVAADGRSLFSRTQRLADLSRRTRRPRLDVDVLLVVVCLVGLWMPVLHVNRTASHASIAVMKHEMRLPRDFEPIVQNAGLSATLADRARVTPSAPARDLAGARAGARGGIDG
jgi:beta-lactamase regulating signal transducer with metallopeptidase domain